MADFSAIVLAGGASSRMGRPKALLPFGGETLVERTARRMGAVASEVIVVTGPQVRLPPMPAAVRVVEDEEPLEGPLSGIRYGMRAASGELLFVCGCDHPFLAPEVAKRIVAHCTDSPDAIGAWPSWKGLPQPLLGAYRRAILPIIEATLARGKRSVMDLRFHVTIANVPSDAILAIDPSARTFFDVDTPEDYARALREL